MLGFLWQAVNFADEFQKRVHKIAFTDSVHDLDSFSARKIRRWMTNVSKAASNLVLF